MSETQIHSLVGAAEERSWSQAQSVKRPEMNVVLVLALRKHEQEGALDLASVGGAVFEKFHAQGEVLRLPSQWYSWIKAEVMELETMGVEVSVMIGYLEADKLWVWGKGSVEALLYRAGNFARIMGGESTNEGMEGVVEARDILVVGTVGATTRVVVEPMRSVFEKRENLVEELAPTFYVEGEAAAQAMVVAEIGEVSRVETKKRAKFSFPKITIKRMSEEPRRFNLVLGGGIMLVLAILVVIGIVSRNRRLSEEAFLGAVGRAETMLKDAESVAGSNPERAKILLAQSKEVIESYLASEPKAEYLRRAKEQLGVIEGKTGDILRVRGKVLTPTIELAVLSEGLKAERMQVDGEFLYFWDERTRGFVGVSVVDLSKVSLAVESERSVRPFTVSEEVYTGVVSGGIWRGSKSEQKVVIPTDEEWGTIAQVATFGNNIYLLDTGMGEVWKYAATETGYAERRRWFGAGIVLDLSKVVDWVVDGDVWLLSASGKLERYSRGVPVSFSLSGFPSESAKGGFVEPVAVTVVDEVVYVLEKGASRVVAIKTDGTYLEQYVASDFSRASDLVIHEGKGYVLVDNVIKEWEL